jgi:hypothetical protein
MIGDRRVVTHDVFDGALLADRDYQSVVVAPCLAILRRVLRPVDCFARSRAARCAHGLSPWGPTSYTPP